MFNDLKFSPSLGSDNHSGAHPRVLAAVVAANRGHAHAYGLDEVSELAAHEFRRVFGDDVQAEYVFNGTAANVLSLAPLLKRYEGVICAAEAHLAVDEGGAPEKFLGTKLLTAAATLGKINPADAEPFLRRRGDQHFAQAGAVSLTLPSELGLCYRPAELEAWREFAQPRNLTLHVDGARLANAAAFLETSLKDLLAHLKPDVVSFGGTKNGLLGAEVVLLFSPRAKDGFKFHRKQAMQLASKTRFLAAQFYAYLKDDLWLEIARHTVSTAKHLAERLAREVPEVRLAYPVESNALFVHLPPAWLKPMRERIFFYVWDQPTHLCRWMISWDWREADTDRLIAHLREVRGQTDPA